MCSSNVAYRRSGISSLTRVSTALERVILRNKRRQVHTGPGSMRSMFETPLWRSTVSYVCVYIHVHVRTYIYIYNKYMHIDRTSGGWVAGAVAGRGLFKIPGCTNQPTNQCTHVCTDRADRYDRVFSPTHQQPACLMKNSSFMPGNSGSRFDIGIMHS